MPEGPTLPSNGQGGANTRFIGKPDQIRNAVNAELGHHAPPVHFHGFLNGPDTGRYLLVKAACNDMFEDFPLPVGESPEALGN